MRGSSSQRKTGPVILAVTLLLVMTTQAVSAQSSATLINLLLRDNPTERAPNPLDGDFARSQLRHPRVREARVNSRYGIKQLYHDRGITYPAAEMFMRVFKRERVLELWVRPVGSSRFQLLKEYRVCALVGDAGPKRRQGDEQTPEGFYEIDSFNPNSQYLLSLHLNYPNDSDRVLGYRESLGGAIFIHGGCKTLGCIAVEDDAIQELYWMAVEARSAGQLKIPVHIFPARLTSEEMTRLGGTFDNRRDLLDFWANLRPGYEWFERTRTLPQITVDRSGRYRFSSPGTRTAAQGSAVNR